MKKLILIGGPMGSGKTTVSKILNQKLPNAVFLDGDWCWKMDPFVVNETNKRMVMNNIQFMLNSFIENPNIEHIIFCWVMDEQSIIDEILSKLDLNTVKVIPVSLLPSIQKLTSNIQKDVTAGIREPNDLNRSIQRLLKYQSLSTIKYDNSQMSPEQLAAEIVTQI